MKTISSGMMALVLEHLDRALIHTRRDTPADSLIESNATFRIHCARDILLRAALADVAVESMREAA